MATRSAAGEHFVRRQVLALAVLKKQNTFYKPHSSTAHYNINRVEILFAMKATSQIRFLVRRSMKTTTERAKKSKGVLLMHCGNPENASDQSVNRYQISNCKKLLFRKSPDCHCSAPILQKPIFENGNLERKAEPALYVKLNSRESMFLHNQIQGALSSVLSNAFPAPILAEMLDDKGMNSISLVVNAS